MKAYKAFNDDMTCRGFEYEVGKTYTHEGEVSLCNSGFHACLIPFDCYNYYEHATTFAEVEINGVGEKKGDDSKVAGAEITITARLDLPEWIKRNAAAVVDACKAAKGALANRGHAAATGDWGHAAATGYRGHAAATGDWGHAAATGNWGHAAATGNWGHAAATGDRGHAAATGDSGHAAATGNWGHAAATGENAIAVSVGPYGIASASVGNWLVLAEYDEHYQIKWVKTVKVDGKKIKGGISYKLKNGKFVRAKQ